jgi:hypothetical protein
MKLLKIILLFLTVSNLYSQKPWELKAGINFSKFRDNDSEFLTNYSFGLSKQINIIGNFFITPEFFITKQGSLLKDKPIKTGYWDWYLYSYNIKAELIYFEIPVFLSYETSLKEYKTHFYAGPSFRISLLGSMDRSKLSNQKVIYDDTNPDRKEEFENYEFEFIQGDYEYSILKSPAWSFNFGTSVNMNYINIECRYTYTFNEIGQIEQLYPLKRYLHSLHLLLGINL